MERLNGNQRAILEENHGLIIELITRRKLNLDENYSLLTDSLVKAILKHDESKGKLSTLFNSIASNDIAYRHRKSQREFLGIEEDYADTLTSSLNFSNGCIIEELSGESLVGQSEPDADFDVSAYLSYLEEFEIKICTMLYEGCTHREIAEEFGVSRQSISKRIKIIRSKVKEALKNESRTKEIKEHIG